MLKKIANILKKIVLGIFILYSFNILSSSLNIDVPINFFTVTMVSLFGIPAIISLVIIKIISF